MSEQTLSLLESIRARIRATARRLTLADLAFGLLLTAGVVLALFLLIVAVEAGFWLGTTPRTVLFWSLIAVGAGLLVIFGVLPGLRLAGVLPSLPEKAVARRIGRHFPEVSDRLVNMLDLADGRRSDAPAPLVDRAVWTLGEQVRAVPFEQIEDFRRARKAGRLVSLPLVGLLLFMIALPGTFFDAAKRVVSPGTPFEQPAPFQLSIEPGTTELVKGEALDIVVRAAGSETPRTITLALNNLDEEHVETITLTADSTGAFRHRVVNVRKSLRYRAIAEPVESAWYEATVVERPLIRSLRVSLDFPDYTRIPSQRLAPNVGDVTALPGTRVGVYVEFVGPDVTEGFLQFDDGRLDTMTIVEITAVDTFALHREGTYQILLRSAQDIYNEAPITYSLNLLADEYPSVVVLAPEPQAELSEDLQANLRLRLNDDFGFARLRLFYRLAESRFGTPQEAFSAIDLPLEQPRQLDQDVLYDWLLNETTGLDLVPGDAVEYYVQVWDNDAVAGYKSATSELHRLRLPSLAEQYRELDEGQDSAEQTMEDLLQETDQLRNQFRELRDELRRNPQSDWEDERQLEQIQQRQQAIEQRVEQLSQQMETLYEQMEKNSLVSPETLELYEELQKTVEEINSPELQEALRQMQEAMQQLNLQQMQESIQSFEFSEQQYRARLERTLELFQRLRMQQGLEEAARRAEELARQQETLAEKTREAARAQDIPLDEPHESNEQDPQNEDGAQGEANENAGQDGQNQEGREQQAGQQNQESQESQEGEQQEQEGEQAEQNRQGEQQAGDPQAQNEALAEEQEQSRREMEALAEQLRELMEQMQQMRNASQQQMQQMQQMRNEAQQMPEQMQQNAEQLRQNQLNEAQQGQQQMQRQLQQMQRQLQQMQQGMQGQQLQINLAGLRRALDDILRLSQRQETLRAGVSRLAADSPMLRESAEQQVELSENLATVSDSLQQLARKIPQMSRAVQQEAGSALREMGAATESMVERAAAQASGHQKASMMHLNELALLLSDLLDQMMNAQSGGGQGTMSMQQMIQQMQQMAGQQEQLNKQIQQMLNDMQGNRLTQDMQQRLRQMAAQQQAIRRQLRELARNPEARGKLLGDLDKIAEQMEETIEELQRNQVNRQTIERQQQILTRMLDAQKSIRERGREKRREGQRPEQEFLDRQSPGELTPMEQADQLRRALIRALESGYAPDYEELIKRYFELLQSDESNP